MATFYGMIQGNHGDVTRTGSKASGIKASLQSYEGSIQAKLSYVGGHYVKPLLYTVENEPELLMVEVSTAEGSSSYGHTIFYGTFEEFKKKLEA